jgi:hypothetical protein
LPDDIAQEVFILAGKNIRQFRHEANFPPGFIRLRLMSGERSTKKHEVLLDSGIMAEPVAEMLTFLSTEVEESSQTWHRPPE